MIPTPGCKRDLPILEQAGIGIERKRENRLAERRNRSALEPGQGREFLGGGKARSSYPKLSTHQEGVKGASRTECEKRKRSVHFEEYGLRSDLERRAARSCSGRRRTHHFVSTFLEGYTLRFEPLAYGRVNIEHVSEHARPRLRLLGP